MVLFCIPKGENTMTNIIKRRKTSHYTQVNNFPIQKDLGDLSAIGLLTYIMSLPEDWVLHKTQLQSVFTRRKIDTAWKILVQKNYAIGFHAHVQGRKNYFYMVSDVAFTHEDFDTFVSETIEELEKGGNSVFKSEAIPDSNFTTKGELAAEISTVQNVHHIPNSSNGATTKELSTKKHKTKKHSILLTIDNLQEASQGNEKAILSTGSTSPAVETSSPEKLFTDACHAYYTEFSVGRWDKKTWNKVVKHFVTETIAKGRHNSVPAYKRNGYVYKALERIATHHDSKKEGKAVKEDYRETMNELFADMGTSVEMPAVSAIASNPNKVPFYNWIEERE